jgi:hypothetical protein
MVERYYLRPGRTIREVKMLEEEALVISEPDAWAVGALTRARNFTKSDGYNLYAVEKFGLPPEVPEKGVAVLPDGSMFHLNDEHELRAFYAQAHGLLDPIELANLLAFFQSKSNARETVIASQEHLAHISERDLASLSGPLLPETTRGEHGELTLSFCTKCVRRARGVFIDLNRWRARADAQARLTWSVKTLAQGLKYCSSSK